MSGGGESGTATPYSKGKAEEEEEEGYNWTTIDQLLTNFFKLFLIELRI